VLKDVTRTTRLLQLLVCCLFMFPAISTHAEDVPEAASQKEQLPMQHQEVPNYRTPHAGEGFRTELFGREITVQPLTGRSVTALDLGVAVNVPGADNKAILPFGDLYLWRHPKDQSLFRADIALLYNDIFWAGSSSQLKSFEWVLTFNSYTIPFAQYELVDGKAVKSEELTWGYVRPGFGLGYRQRVSPGHQDNMLAVDLTVEPGFLFFDKGSNTAGNFVVPNNAFELREHLQFRWDAFERNLLSLPQQGFAVGADVVHGNRTNWKNWGLNGSESADGRDYFLCTGYFLAAGRVPGVDSDRHRLIGSLHAGVGSNLDRFSAPRIGGGVQPMGVEYGSTWRPVLPGSVIQEFFPKHYVVAAGEYRWEALFFTYLSLNGSVGWLDHLTQTGRGTISKNDVFTSLGARVTTGFFFDTNMKLGYNYNFGVIRDGRHGGHEIVLYFIKAL